MDYFEIFARRLELESLSLILEYILAEYRLIACNHPSWNLVGYSHPLIPNHSLDKNVALRRTITEVQFTTSPKISFQ